ncbi:hypothetical protein [Flavimaricola marinus]|uniref:Uncharacterized protein n=1 Tax=Flavimaricola marinus TaxID=1819565 RepID=A0A238LI67_9RHOB|nr:hypothetical protein [Flavimaricola marinus]SMY09104.1 hypothetical protein LOM8899_03266 [Flavimaricola marinus]
MRRLYHAVTDTDWLYLHRGKIAGFAFGTFGTWTITLFFVVAITGVPVGGQPKPVEQVYFIE